MSDLTNNYTLTIPQELVEICKLNFKKPIYLCKDWGDKLFLTNNKKQKSCYGIIDLSKEYSFKVSEEVIRTIDAPFVDGMPLYEVYLSDGILYFDYPYYLNKQISYSGPVKIHISPHVLDVSKLNFKKAVYLCTDGYGTIYLSNTQKNAGRCFGKILLDSENSFTLTKNMRISLGINSNKNLLVFSFEKIIFIEKQQ